MTKLETLLEAYQGNAWPGMVESLAGTLGVSVESLTRLGIGWAPIVPLKKGPSFTGWWVFPERDAAGTLLGLSLRSQTGKKIMYPGSKHGLFYPMNPNHVKGQVAYTPGAHNWVRLIDAKLPCPVCAKSDGCLLDVNNPEDPARVICLRVKTGSARTMRMGYLHYLKPQGAVAGAILPDSDLPVLVVEGASDAAAAMDLGFIVVGRPSNLACMDMLCDLLRNREVLVMGENDELNPVSRTRPGEEGMIAAYQMIKRVTTRVGMFMPPAHVKDLRNWRTVDSIDAAGLIAYAEANSRAGTVEVVLPDDRPKTLAVKFLDEEHRMAGRHLLKRWQGSWYKYGGAKYAELQEEVVEQPLFGWSHQKQVAKTTPDGATTLEPLWCGSTVVNNILRAMKAETLVTDENIPCWINGADGPDPKNLIVFENGILNVEEFIDGQPESTYLLDSTPDLFTTNSLPYSLDVTAKCPAWLQFLEDCHGHEPERMNLLQEWFGYCMIPDTSLHKLMFMRGPTAAGKSVTLNMLSKLVGDSQTATTSFSSLTNEHGVHPLMHKLVCLIPDARNSRNTDNMRGLELLLNIAGGDSVSINPKYKSHIARHQLTCRITIASNEFLDVPDHSGAMLRRLNLVEFDRTFVGQEDFNLEHKLASEIQGIAVWALQGLRSLRKRGHFTLPGTSREAMREWRTSTSPLAAFLEECTDEGDTHVVLKQELFDAWTAWSRERGMRPLSKSKFYERLRSNAPYISSRTHEAGGTKHSVFHGLQVKAWAAKTYLGSVA